MWSFPGLGWLLGSGQVEPDIPASLPPHPGTPLLPEPWMY